MRAAFIGADGVFRDSEGAPVSHARRARARARRPHPPAPVLPPSVPPPARHRAQAARGIPGFASSPYRVGLGQIPKLPAPASESPAMFVAKQVGVPAKDFNFSLSVADPTFAIYPGRMVYQKSGDDLSLYVISFRPSLEEADAVHLFKIEGPGRGRWQVVPIRERRVIEGQMRPALLPDFMVVPYKFTQLIWGYVGPVGPIFRKDTTAEEGYARTNPLAIRAGFTVALETLERVPGDVGQITDAAAVYDNAGAALSGTIYALDSAGAAVDVSMIGFRAFKEYQRVGLALYKAASKLVTLAIGAMANPETLPAVAREIAGVRNTAVGSIQLQEARLLQAELWTDWNTAISLTTWQEAKDDAITVMTQMLDVIDTKRDHLLRQGFTASQIESVRALSDTAVSQYNRYRNQYWDAFQKYTAEYGVSRTDLYGAVTQFPNLVRDNQRRINELRAGQAPTPGAADARLLFLGALTTSSKKAIDKIVESIGAYRRRVGRPNIGVRVRLVEESEPHIMAFYEGLAKTEKAWYRNFRDDKDFMTTREMVAESKRLEAEAAKFDELAKVAKAAMEKAKDPATRSREEAAYNQSVVNARGKRADAKAIDERLKTERGTDRDKADLILKLWEAERGEGNIPDMPSGGIRAKTFEDRVKSALMILTNRDLGGTFTTPLDSAAPIKNLAQFMYDWKGAGIPAEAWEAVIKDIALRTKGHAKRVVTVGDVLAEGAVAYRGNVALLEAGKAAESKIIDIIDGKIPMTPDALKKEFPRAHNPLGDKKIKEAEAKRKEGKESPIPEIREKAEAEYKEWREKEFLMSEGTLENHVRETLALRYMIEELASKDAIAKRRETSDAAVGRAINLSAERERLTPEELEGKSVSRADYDSFHGAVKEVLSLLPEEGEGKPLVPGGKGFNALVSELVSKDQPLGKSLALIDPELKIEIEKLWGRVKERAKLLDKEFAFDKGYDAFQELVRTGVIKQETLSRALKNIEELGTLMRELETKVKDQALPKARHTGWVLKPFSLTYSLFNAVFNLRDGMTMWIIDRLKGGGHVLQALGGIVATAALFGQVIAISYVAGLLGVPGADIVSDFLTGLLRKAASFFGGDAPQSQWPPRRGADATGVGSLGLLGIAFAIAMVAYGKPVFDALGKTVGGFFQFATALLPSSAKKKGAKGAPGGPGRRRGARIDVDQWMTSLEAARERLRKAQEAGDKRAERVAERDVEKAIDKLKKAKEEGETVPEGLWNLWGFNWLG